jgi:hypothetical protein
MRSEELKTLIRTSGEKVPKKHGEWYRLKFWDEHYLVLDTWNGQIYHYPNGCEPSDTDNMYRCVYVFFDKAGSVSNYKSVKGKMIDFWLAHKHTLSVGHFLKKF